MAFIGGSHSWRKHDHLVGHRKGVGKILLAKGLVTYRLELVPRRLVSAASSCRLFFHSSVRPRGCLGSLEGGEDCACLDRPCFIDAAGDEAIERFAHRAHRADLAFELPFLLDRAFADVPAAGGIAAAQDEELAYLREREAALLGLFDEAQPPRRILVVEPVPGRTLAGRLDQTLALVIAQRVAPDARGGSELADGEHGRPPRSACTLEVRPRSSLGKRVPHARGYAGRPSPAARRVALSTPRPAQHAASLPSMTTAGTERMPSPLARFATSTSRMSWTIT